MVNLLVLIALESIRRVNIGGGSMDTMAVIASVSLILTFAIFLMQVIFKTGQMSARIEALEGWRTNVRGDLHEISEKLEAVVSELRSLSTLVDERTDRREVKRP